MYLVFDKQKIELKILTNIISRKGNVWKLGFFVVRDRKKSQQCIICTRNIGRLSDSAISLGFIYVASAFFACLHCRKPMTFILIQCFRSPYPHQISPVKRLIS